VCSSDLDPRAIAFLEKMVELPGRVDLDHAPKIGPVGLISAGFDPEIKEGLGVMIALTKAMGKLKSNGIGTEAPPPA
jgi:uncharacterized protein YjgD (DUF1641 family)